MTKHEREQIREREEGAKDCWSTQKQIQEIIQSYANDIPKLLIALDELDAKVAELEHAISRARVFIKRAQSTEEDGEGCKSTYVEKARDALSACDKKGGAK